MNLKRLITSWNREWSPPPFVVLMGDPMTECIRIQFVLWPSLFHANPTAFRFHCRYNRALCVPFAT